MNPGPPKRVLQFLRWFCREDYLEEVEGDLTEVFERNMPALPAKRMEIRMECDQIPSGRNS